MRMDRPSLSPATDAPYRVLLVRAGAHRAVRTPEERRD